MSIDSTDQDLLARVRAGDTTAFGELYAHHSAAARRAARRISRDPHLADDLVSESFTRVFKALRTNNGPTGDLFPYLLVTMRNVAATWGRDATRMVPVADDDSAFAPRDARDLVSGADEAPVEKAAVSMTSRAFATLPSRWRTVLWYLEVEGESATQVGRRLGLSDTAVRQLARRAREGLREAYLTAYLGGAAVQGAHIPPDDLAAMARGTISIRRRGQVEGHLDTCPRCAALLLEVAEENSTLRILYLPLYAALGYAVVQWLQKLVGFLRPRGRVGRASSALQPAVLAAVAVIAVTAITAAIVTGWFGGSSGSGDRGSAQGPGSSNAGGATGRSGPAGSGTGVAGASAPGGSGRSGSGGASSGSGGGTGGAGSGDGAGPDASPTTIQPLPGGGGAGAGGGAGIGGVAVGGVGLGGAAAGGGGGGTGPSTTTTAPGTAGGGQPLPPVVAPSPTSPPASNPPTSNPAPTPSAGPLSRTPQNRPSAPAPSTTTRPSTTPPPSTPPTTAPPVTTPPVTTPPVTTPPVTTPPVTTPPVVVALRVEVDATRTTDNGGTTTLSFRIVNDTATAQVRTTTVSFVLPAGVRLGHDYSNCDERAGIVSCQIGETLAPSAAGQTHTLELRHLAGDHSPVTEPIDFTVTGVLVA